jgi:hypothetical protein
MEEAHLSQGIFKLHLSRRVLRAENVAGIQKHLKFVVTIYVVSSVGDMLWYQTM